MKARVWIGVVCLACAASTARAQPAPAVDTVALLPLDADARLEIYGQPVASEIARALVAGGLDVVVVLPKMAVPERARLIVDGAIKAGKGDAVLLSIRVRNPADGTVLEKLEATATNLGTIDRAAAELSSRVLPVVRERIAALGRPPPVRPIDRPIQVTRAPKGLLVGIAVSQSSTAAVEPLRLALGGAVAAWNASTWQVVPVEPSTLGPKLAPLTVAAAKVEHGVAFEILAYSVSTDEVPLARARVRVRIADPGAVVFDRVIVTDTVVGDRAIAPDALATRVAREVLAILRPHLRRVEPAWR